MHFFIIFLKDFIKTLDTSYNFSGILRTQHLVSGLFYNNLYKMTVIYLMNVV